MMQCPQCNGDLAMPSLKCAECGVRFRGCPHCFILVDVNELYCPKCGRPLPSTLPLDDEAEVDVAASCNRSASTDSDRLSRLEIGFGVPAATLDKPTVTPPSSPASGSTQAAKPIPPIGSVLKGVVKDERDPLEQIPQRYRRRYETHLWMSPFERDAAPYVLVRAIVTVAFAIFFLIFVMPMIYDLPVYEIEGIRYDFIRTWANAVVIGIAALVVIYTIIYFIVYRPSTIRRPPDGS
jgi:hypothetical protein